MNLKRRQAAASAGQARLRNCEFGRVGLGLASSGLVSSRHAGRCRSCQLRAVAGHAAETPTSLSDMRHPTTLNQRGRQRHDMHGHTCARQKYEAMHASIEAVLYTPAVTPVPGLLHNQIKLQYRTMPSSHQQRRFPSRAASGGLAASPFAAAAARVVGPSLATAGTAAAPAACKALPRAPAPGLACPLAGAVTPHPRL